MRTQSWTEMQQELKRGRNQLRGSKAGYGNRVGKTLTAPGKNMSCKQLHPLLEKTAVLFANQHNSH